MTDRWRPPLAEPTADRGYHDLRLHGLMIVGAGEAERWLDACVRWTAPALDSLFVYADSPDRSTAELLTVLARPAPEGVGNLQVVYRGVDEPGFLDHEGAFRRAAWERWEEATSPRDGDWLLLPDADEFAVPCQELVGLRAALQASAALADLNGQNAVAVPIPEVWGFAADGRPLERTDGRWHGNAGPRFVRWQPGVTWSDRQMGGGSVPAEYLMSPGDPAPEFRYGVSFAWLLHYGYADPADVRAKWERYSSREHGHNDAHIRSIRQAPKLAPLKATVPVPDSWRGPRKP